MKLVYNFPKLTKLDNIENELINKAPINHAVADKSCGTGSNAKYGHVKVTDSYKTSNGTASEGVAASSKAVADAYTEVYNKLDKVLWSNTVTTGGTEPQTIYLSDTDYDYIEVHSTYNGSCVTPAILYKGKQGFISFGLHNTSVSTDGYLYVRMIELSADGARLVVKDGKDIIIKESTPTIANEKNTIIKVIGKYFR